MDNSKPLAIRYADAVDQIDAQRKSIDALTAQVAQLEAVTADNVALQAKVVELEASIVATGEAHNAAIVEKATHIETLTAEVTALKGQLALSPAHLDLSAGTPAIKDQAAESANDLPIKDQFAAIKNPVERTAFFKKNAKALWNEASK